MGISMYASTMPGSPAHTRRFWYAYAVIAARDEIPSFVNMLLMCRATVFSLKPSASAIALFVFPVATSASTSSSRAVSCRGPLTRA